MGVDDQAGDFVLFVGDQGLLKKMLEGNVGQRHLRGNPLGIIVRRDFGQIITGTRGAGLGHDFFEAVEAVRLRTDRMGKARHTGSP
ncbi:hypothetical protein ALP75_200275 [Pseudomonas syringae pv. actinidiae]|nr:hypothetical protein ALP75_200275 [Pseudomonas syringae pv. actinidiae]